MVAQLMRRANHKSVKIHLPVDFVIGDVGVGEMPSKKKKPKKKVVRDVDADEDEEDCSEYIGYEFHLLELPLEDYCELDKA